MAKYRDEILCHMSHMNSKNSNWECVIHPDKIFVYLTQTPTYLHNTGDQGMTLYSSILRNLDKLYVTFAVFCMFSIRNSNVIE